jgi:prepilin peptidase CpaA
MKAVPAHPARPSAGRYSWPPPRPLSRYKHLLGGLIVHPVEIALLVFPALLAFAATSDLLTMTISNRLCVALALAFVPLALLGGLGVGQIGTHVVAGAAMLALGFALVAAGWIGGGDAKLAAAIMLWMGPEVGLAWGLLAAVFGGLLTLMLVSVRMMPLPVLLAGQPWIARLHASDSGVPYGIALAAAGLMAYPHSDIYLRLVG